MSSSGDDDDDNGASEEASSDLENVAETSAYGLYVAVSHEQGRELFTAATQQRPSAAALNAALSNGHTLLGNAVLWKDVAMIRELAAAGADVDARDEFGHTALTLAAESGCVEAAVVLLDELGASIRAPGRSGLSACAVAAASEQAGVFACLLARGASVLEYPEPHESLLFQTSTEIAVAALTACPELVNVGDEQGVLAVLVAAPELLPWLKAFVAARGEALDLDEALAWACGSNVEGAKFLLAQPHVQADAHALLRASAFSLELVDLLLDRDDVDVAQSLALFAAIEGSQIAIVRRLLERGADARALNAAGATPLHLASLPELQSLELFSLLVPLSDVNCVCENEPALMFLVHVRMTGGFDDEALAMARLLIDAGTDLHAHDEFGFNVLHLACTIGTSLPLVRMLFDACPELMDDVNREGCMPLHAACIGEGDDEARDAILQFFLDKGCDWRAPMSDESAHSPALLLACHGRIGGLEKLLARGLDVNECNEHGMSLVYGAASGGHLELAKWLVARGARINVATTAASTEIGETPLYVACETTNNAELAEFLIQAGARIDQRTVNGTSPLMVAVRNGHPAVVRCLLRHGADRTRPDGQALFLDAIAGGHWQVIVALVAHGVPVGVVPTAALKQRIKSRGHLHVLFLLLLLDCVGEAAWFGRTELFVAAAMFELPLALDVQHVAQHPAFVAGLRARTRSLAQQFNDFVKDDVASLKLALVNPRALDICIALQPIGLPALITLAIIDEACELAPVLPMHLKWNAIAKVKHWHEQR